MYGGLSVLGMYFRRFCNCPVEALASRKQDGGVSKGQWEGGAKFTAGEIPRCHNSQTTHHPDIDKALDPLVRQLDHIACLHGGATPFAL